MNEGTLFSYELVELSENDNSVFINVLQTPKPLNHKSSRSSKPNKLTQFTIYNHKYINYNGELFSRWNR